MTARPLDSFADGVARTGKSGAIESSQPLTDGMANAFSPRWISDQAAVELLNNDGLDPTRPAKRDGYEKIRQTTTGISAGLLTTRPSGLGYLSPSLGTKLLVMAIPKFGAGGIFYTPDPELTPWAQAGVGGPVYALVTQTYNVWNDLTSPTPDNHLAGDASITMKAGTEVGAVVSLTMGAFSTHKFLIITEAGVPGTTTWPSTAWTAVLKFNAPGAAGLSVICNTIRYSAGNVSLEAGAGFTASQAIPAGGGTLTFSVPATTWTSPSATDRLGLQVAVTSGTGLTLAAELVTGDASSYVATDFTVAVNNTVGWDPLADDVKMFQANDRLWILPAKEIALAVMDNTAALTLSAGANEDAPDGIVDGAAFLNRVWLIDKNNKLYWSMLQPTTPIGSFDRATDVLTFSPNRGSRIVAMRPWRTTSLLLFFNDSIEEMQVDAGDVLAGSIRNLVEPDFGCCSRDGIVAVGDDFYFIDQYGQVRSLAQTEQLKISGLVKTPLSHPIREELPGRVNQQYRHRMRLHSEGDEIHVFYPRDSSTQANYRAIYSMTFQRWVSVDSLADGVAKVLRSDIRGEWETFLLDGDDSPAVPLAYITDQGTYLDNATAISYRETTKAYGFDAFESNKVPRWVELEYFGDVGGIPTVEARVNEAVAWTTLTRMSGDTQVGTPGASSFPLLPGDFPLLPADFPLVTAADTTAFARTTYRMDSQKVLPGRSVQLRITEASAELEFKRIAWHLVVEPNKVEATRNG